MEQSALNLPAEPSGRRFVIELSDLTGEIAKRHGVRVRRDDPALMVLTAFEIVSRRLAAEMELAINRANDDASALTAQTTESARAVGVEVVDAAVEYQARKMREVVDELAPVLATQGRKLLVDLGQEIGAVRQSTARAERRSWIAALVAGSCALLTVGVVVGRFW